MSPSTIHELVCGVSKHGIHGGITTRNVGWTRIQEFTDFHTEQVLKFVLWSFKSNRKRTCGSDRSKQTPKKETQCPNPGYFSKIELCRGMKTRMQQNIPKLENGRPKFGISVRKSQQWTIISVQQVQAAWYRTIHIHSNQHLRLAQHKMHPKYPVSNDFWDPQIRHIAKWRQVQ